MSRIAGFIVEGDLKSATTVGAAFGRKQVWRHPFAAKGRAYVLMVYSPGGRRVDTSCKIAGTGHNTQLMRGADIGARLCRISHSK